MMRLSPSEIYYSQDSVNCYFDRKSSHSGVAIGETLDSLCEGRCSIYSIPTISVMWREDRWVTADNRRLWVFRHLERLGKCDTIPVRQTYHINPAKFTSYNNGKSIHVRGSPGGWWHTRPDVKKPSPPPAIVQTPAIIPFYRPDPIPTNTYTSNSYSNAGFNASGSDSESEDLDPPETDLDETVNKSGSIHSQNEDDHHPEEKDEVVPTPHRSLVINETEDASNDATEQDQKALEQTVPETGESHDSMVVEMTTEESGDTGHAADVADRHRPVVLDLPPTGFRYQERQSSMKQLCGCRCFVILAVSVFILVCLTIVLAVVLSNK